MLLDERIVAILMSSFVAASWDDVKPSSFKTTLYLPTLRVAVAAGSFILYDSNSSTTVFHAPDTTDVASSTVTESNELHEHVGRIIEVVDAVESIQDLQISPSFRCAMRAWQEQDSSALTEVQYVKVNVFEDHALFPNKLFPGKSDQECLSETSLAKWQRLVQLCRYVWIPTTAVLGLSFVFPEQADGELVAHTFDDCRGMYNVYLLQHRIDSAGVVSCIPRNECPPFPTFLESFRNLWAVDHSQMIFNGIRQIRQNMQQSLCRVAQSQGDFSVKKTKLQLPNCCWYYIKNVLASAKEIRNVSTIVTYSQPKTVLSWGLSLHSSPYVGSLDVIRFDTKEKMDVFRRLFGIMAGFGVRKRRPKYSDGKAPLSLNDVLNIISPPSRRSEDDVCDGAGGHHSFKLFGITRDGIDLAYDAADGVLQITLRYRKMVVTNSSLALLSSVGVAAENPPDDGSSSDSSVLAHDDISPGMEFVDHMYIMQVQESFANKVCAKRVYKIVRNESGRSRTLKLQSSEQTVIYYTDIAYVLRQLQKMIE